MRIHFLWPRRSLPTIQMRRPSKRSGCWMSSEIGIGSAGGQAPLMVNGGRRSTFLKALSSQMRRGPNTRRAKTMPRTILSALESMVTLFFFLFPRALKSQTNQSMRDFRSSYIDEAPLLEGRERVQKPCDVRNIAGKWLKIKWTFFSSGVVRRLGGECLEEFRGNVAFACGDRYNTAHFEKRRDFSSISRR